jgi:lysophospholipid acyltransferase (LPLAT)-like uncharacterized protein
MCTGCSTLSAMPEATSLTDRDRASPASLWLRRAAGAVLLGGWIRLVSATSGVTYEPPDALDRLRELMPFILTCWHGQGFLTFAVVAPDRSRMHILISRHPDGQIVAGAAGSMGLRLIEGSGANFKEPRGTGGMAAIRQMLRVLARGGSVGLTADVPPIPGREVSDGLPLLAKLSGRPIVPFNIATSRRRVVESQWDKVQINYPFSRIAVVMGDPVWVPGDASDFRPYSKTIGAELDRTLELAFAIADGAPPRG